MNYAAYNDIAEWYNSYLEDNPIYQELLLPSMLELIGDVQGQAICDLACGQGWFARELARRGALVTGVDIADRLLTLARQYEEQEPLGIMYQQDDVQSASSLSNARFDGAVCILSLMDIPDVSAVLQTARHLLKAGGWLAFAITHPCFEAPHARWIMAEDGQTARAVSNYFQEGYWRSASGGVRSRVGAQHRTVSTYLNALAAAGFVLERLLEPRAGGERAEQVPGNRDVPSLLCIRAHL